MVAVIGKIFFFLPFLRILLLLLLQIATDYHCILAFRGGGLTIASSSSGLGRSSEPRRRRMMGPGNHNHNIIPPYNTRMMIPNQTTSSSSSLLNLHSSQGNNEAKNTVDDKDVDWLEEDKKIVGQPPYSMANVDLSRRWIDLVRDNQVSATVRIPMTNNKNKNGNEDNNDKTDNAATAATATVDDVAVRYGVRLVTRDSVTFCEEFVIQVEEEEDQPQQQPQQPHPIIETINSTLTSLQEQATSTTSDTATTTTVGSKSRNSNPTAVVQYGMDGDFCAQLQLVRTLRPPPSRGFSSESDVTTTTSIPPPYDSDIDSFVTGPLRLELRPLVATLQQHTALTTPWDVYHNVSPADTRGHFLLIPTLSSSKKDNSKTTIAETNNWRGQIFTPNDCQDIVHLTSTIRPKGSLLVGFNSVGAGASQNHIHCHAWPSPPVPLQLAMNSDENDDEGENGTLVDGWNCYAASKVKGIYDFCDLYDKSSSSNGDDAADSDCATAVEISYLNYPVFCIQLSATTSHLTRLSQAVATTLDSIGDAPFNIGFLNRPVEQYDDDDDEEMDNGDKEETEVIIDEEESTVDVFVFVRSKERSTILPSLKLGISEMMGVFHAQSDVELQTLVKDSGGTLPTSDEDNKNGKDGPMMRALEEVSYQDEGELWDTIKANLMG